MSAQHAVLESVDFIPAAEPAPARLSVREVCLTLGKRVVLDDISFDVRHGEIFGLLGPNGSGKTSLMRCLTGLLKTDRGTLWLDGQALDAKKGRLARSRMGVVFQEPSLDAKLTGRENLILGAALFGVRGADAKERTAELLQFMELSDRADEPSGILSGGMRRRLELARALISRPSVLLLDEPTTGLDMYAFERTWQRLLALRRIQDLSILVSTHRADEAERCDRLAIFDRGHVVACDTPQHLLARVSGDVVIIEADRPQEVVDALCEQLDLPARLVDGDIQIEQEGGHELIPRLVEAFPAGRFRSVSLRRPTLADAFFHLTGRTLAEAEEDLP